MKKEFTREELEARTVADLRTMCVYELDIPGMSKKRKDVVIDAILEKYGASPSISNVDSNKVTDISAVFTSSFTKPSARFGDRCTTTILVSSGAASGRFDVVGKTVGAVSEFLREVLNIDKMADGIVNGKQVPSGYVLQFGDNLEFLKPAGGKGYK